MIELLESLGLCSRIALCAALASIPGAIFWLLVSGGVYVAHRMFIFKDRDADSGVGSSELPSVAGSSQTQS
jgi:hypothetical protein